MEILKFLPKLLLVCLVIGIVFILLPNIKNIKNKSVSESMDEKVIKLPLPKYDSETSVEKALLERRSVRSYKDEPLTLSEVSQLLWAAQGITEKEYGLRTAPSAGALYPLEVYVVTGNVNDLPVGVYKYKPQNHELMKVTEGDKRIELYHASLSQDPIKNAPVTFVFTGVYERTTGKYGERGVRYVHIEVGHAAQNVYLQATSLDLGNVVIGAFDDSQVKKALGIPEEEEPLYVVPVGKK